MLSPAGQRLRHTLRKLPKARPNRPAKIVPRMRIRCGFEARSMISWLEKLMIEGWARLECAKNIPQGLKPSLIRRYLRHG